MSNRRWCCKFNNYTEKEYQHLVTIFNNDSICNYVVVGREVGENGTPNLEIFVRFVCAQRQTYLLNALSPKGHYEMTQSDTKVAIYYCKKNGSFEEFGKFPLLYQAKKHKGMLLCKTDNIQKVFEFVQFEGDSDNKNFSPKIDLNIESAKRPLNNNDDESDDSFTANKKKKLNNKNEIIDSNTSDNNMNQKQKAYTKPDSNRRWNENEKALLIHAIGIYGSKNHISISKFMSTYKDISTRSPNQIKHFICNEKEYINGRISKVNEEKLDILKKEKKEEAKRLYMKECYKQIKIIRQSQTKDGFKQLLKSYNDPNIWIIKRNGIPLPDPTALTFTKINNYGYMAMLQIIFCGSIRADEIRFDMNKKELDVMFEKVFKRMNQCAYCKNCIDLFRSGFLTNINKDRVRSDLPYFHPEQMICCVCECCNKFFGSLSPEQRIELILLCKIRNTHNGEIDFTVVANRLDIIRNKVYTWSMGYSYILENNCSKELNDLILSERMVSLMKRKFQSQKDGKHDTTFESYYELVHLFQGYEGQCCVTGIQLSYENGRCNLEFDRKTDNLPYGIETTQLVYRGVNRGKACWGGEDNSMYENSNSFNNFVLKRGFLYGLKLDNVENDLDDNVVLLSRRFFQDLVSNYEEFHKYYQEVMLGIS